MVTKVGVRRAQRWLKPLDSSGVIDTDTGCRSKCATALREVGEEQLDEVAADVLADEHALHRDVADRSRSAVRRHLPPLQRSRSARSYSVYPGSVPSGRRHATAGMLVAGSPSQMISNGPSFGISSARTAQLSYAARWTSV